MMSKNQMPMTSMSWEVWSYSFTPVEGNSKLQLLQLNGLLSKLSYEDPHEHLRNFVDVCKPLLFQNISQESVIVLIFSDGRYWNFITVWEKLIIALPQRWWLSGITFKAFSACMEILYTKLGYGLRSWYYNAQAMVFLIICSHCTFTEVWIR